MDEFDRVDGDDSPALADPIKVRWGGDSRLKYETRTLEPLSADGFDGADAARRANARQVTQLDIRTEKELAGTLDGLAKHIDFSGQYGAHWGSESKKRAAERVDREIRHAAEAQGVDVDAALERLD